MFFFSYVFFFEKSKNSKKSSQKNSPEQRAPRLVREHFFRPKKPIFSTKNLIFCENFLKIRFLKNFFWAKKIDFSTKKNLSRICRYGLYCDEKKTCDTQVFFSQVFFSKNRKIRKKILEKISTYTNHLGQCGKSFFGPKNRFFRPKTPIFLKIC